MNTAPGNPERQGRKAFWKKAAKDKVFLKDIKDFELAFNTADSELELAEVAGDIAAFEGRGEESLVIYDEMVKRLKRDGLI